MLELPQWSQTTVCQSTELYLQHTSLVQIQLYHKPVVASEHGCLLLLSF